MNHSLRKKTMHTFKFKILLLLLLLVAVKPDLLAQDPEGTIEFIPGLQDLTTIDDVSSDDEEDLAVEIGSMGLVPVDGGISLLLAAGAAYGVRRVRRKAIK